MRETAVLLKFDDDFLPKPIFMHQTFSTSSTVETSRHVPSVFVISALTTAPAFGGARAGDHGATSQTFGSRSQLSPIAPWLEWPG